MKVISLVELKDKMNNDLIYNNEFRIQSIQYNQIKKYLNDKGYKVSVDIFYCEDNTMEISIEKSGDFSLESYCENYAFFIADEIVKQLPKEAISKINEDTNWDDIEEIANEYGIDIERIKVENEPYFEVPEALEFINENHVAMDLVNANFTGMDELRYLCNECIQENTSDRMILNEIKEMVNKEER